MKIEIKNKKMICTDVLQQQHYEYIFKTLTNDTFPWNYNDHVVDTTEFGTEEKHQLQFIHKFHEVSTILTEPKYWQMLFPIFEVLRPHTFIRVKANNIPGKEKIITHGMHTDTGIPLSYTAIYYVNSNNGFTEFDNGDRVDSVANSMIVFPSYMRHTGSTCTDARSRINININFLAHHGNEFIKPIVPQEANDVVKLWKDTV
jgi:hypothetical protein